MSSAYRFKAIPTKVKGVWYDSRLEGRLATLLHAHKVKFTPHVKYEVFDRTGNRFFYTVDFLLHEKHRFVGIPLTIQALEAKGILSKRDIHRVEALDYCHFVKTWLVSENMILMWETEGMFWKESDKTL